MKEQSVVVCGTPCQPDEKVSVRSIRVMHRRLRATAVVGSFFAVDKLLLEWSVRCNGVLDCEFEIMYQDGRTLRGNYRFRRKGASRPALMQFVRASVLAMCDNAERTCTVSGLAHRPRAFLERYETEDFALA
jgi:hypothetical protein